MYMHMYRCMYKKSNSHLSRKITFAPNHSPHWQRAVWVNRRETVIDKLWSPTAKIMEWNGTPGRMQRHHVMPYAWYAYSIMVSWHTTRSADHNKQSVACRSPRDTDACNVALVISKNVQYSTQLRYNLKQLDEWEPIWLGYMYGHSPQGYY